MITRVLQEENRRLRVRERNTVEAEAGWSEVARSQGMEAASRNCKREGHGFSSRAS